MREVRKESDRRDDCPLATLLDSAGPDGGKDTVDADGGWCRSLEEFRGPSISDSN